jgi:type IV fimbrial biogenesis protein FimT
MDTRSQLGVTLIELLFALAVMAILGAAAAPSFSRAVARNQVSSTDNALVAVLDFTRQRAVTAGADALLCPSSDGASCDNGTHWERGWLVAIDADRDGHPDGVPLVVQDALPEGVVVRGSVGRMRVRYHADGSAPGSNLSLIVCRKGQPQGARSVIVSNSGRPRQGRPTAAQARACAGPG